MQASLIERHDAVASPRDQPAVVRRHQYGDAHAVELFEQTQDIFRQRVVQVAGRFVRQQHGWLVHYGARNADALLFAAGELNRKAFRLIEQTDFIQRRRHARRISSPLAPEMISGIATLS